MMNKRGVGTMTGVIISIIIVMAIFMGGYEYITDNYDSAGVTIDSKYSNSYADIETHKDNLSTNIDDIKDAANQIVEADANIALVAWNGLTGLSATIQVMFSTLGIAVSVWDTVFPPLDFLPTWVKVLAQMAIIIFIVLIILGLFKGEAKT